MSFNSDYDSDYESEYESEYDSDVFCDDEEEDLYEPIAEDISEEYIYFSAPIRCVACNTMTSDPFHSCNIPLTLERKIEIIETNLNLNKHDLFINSEPMNIPPYLKIDGKNFINNKLLLVLNK